MNFNSTMGIIAGLLQFVVAGYALRLTRLFGTARVGWSLFGAFSLLALLHLIQSLTAYYDGAMLGVKIEVIYSLISLLLLTSMTHMETLLKERRKSEGLELELRKGLEVAVQKQTVHLTRAIEELQYEIDERKRLEAQAQATQQELVLASHQAQMAKIAHDVLDNVGKILASINISAGLVSSQLKQSKMANVTRLGNLIRDHSGNLADFLANDPRGQKLPVYIAQLAEYLEKEQEALASELDSLKRHIKSIAALQQNYLHLAGQNDAQADFVPELDTMFLMRKSEEELAMN